MKTTWVARAYGIIGEASTTVKDGITTYNPGQRGWFDLKEFTDFEEADNWLCKYIKDNGYYYGDFKVARKEA